MQNTGPALNNDEAIALLSLFRHSSWEKMNEYLARMKQAAHKNLQIRNQSMEDNGYWKGIIYVIEDLQSMPKALEKQIHGGKNG